MNLQELMGDAYKESMTLEEVNNFFKGKNFADLSTGNYVDKNKYDNKVNELNSQLENANNQLNEKLSDGEKEKKHREDQDKEIKRLQQLLSENTISGNKNVVNSVLASARETLSIDANDTEFTKFIENITSEDSTKSSDIAKYISKMVNDSYEKGKQDATRDDMGKFGKGSPSSSKADDDIGEVGKRLANLNKSQDKKTFNYFE